MAEKCSDAGHEETVFACGEGVLCRTQTPTRSCPPGNPDRMTHTRIMLTRSNRLNQIVPVDGLLLLAFSGGFIVCPNSTALYFQ